MTTETMLAIFAIAVALGLVGALVIETVILPQQQAEAKGCINSHAPGGGIIAFNASQGRCFH
jgi:hypothetical protein